MKATALLVVTPILLAPTHDSPREQLNIGRSLTTTEIATDEDRP